MRNRIGELWIGLGVMHLVVIALLGWGTLADIVSDGYVNAVEPDTQRIAFFWLLYLGVPFILLGIITRWAQRRTGTVPEALGWAGAVSFLVGALAVPVSGFWLGLLLSGYIVIVARQDAARQDAARHT